MWPSHAYRLIFSTAVTKPFPTVDEAPGYAFVGIQRLVDFRHAGSFVPEIDGLRFVATASVVLYRLRGFVVAGRADTSGRVPAFVLKRNRESSPL
jgi:hypothetical protein